MTRILSISVAMCLIFAAPSYAVLDITELTSCISFQSNPTTFVKHDNPSLVKSIVKLPVLLFTATTSTAVNTALTPLRVLSILTNTSKRFDQRKLYNPLLPKGY